MFRAQEKPERLKLSKVGSVKLEKLEEVHAKPCKPSKGQQMRLFSGFNVREGQDSFYISKDLSAA